MEKLISAKSVAAADAALAGIQVTSFSVISLVFSVLAVMISILF